MSDGLDSALERAATELGNLAMSSVPIGPMTTYRVGGPAALFVEARTTADLDRVAAARRASRLEVLVVGNGSNLLVADSGFAGIAVRLSAGFSDVAREGDVVAAGGAALLPVVARRSAGWGLRGFEWAVGVPGSIGGAVRMNAGGHGSDIAATLVGVRLFDLDTGKNGYVTAGDLNLGYRRSAVQPTQVVVDARLRLAPGDSVAAEREISEIVRWRRENQPGGTNAGSVFTNPPDDSAGRLIELAGCKGLRKGSAAVSTKHANFIQADPGGVADDVFGLMCEVARRVRADSGVSLQPETQLVGLRWPDGLDPAT